MPTKRKAVKAFGQPRTPEYVRVFTEPVAGTVLCRVTWREPGEKRPRYRSFADSKAGHAEAKAYAQGVYDRLRKAPLPEPTVRVVSVRELGAEYIASRRADWRRNTERLETARWDQFALFVDARTDASTITTRHVDRFKAALLNQTVRHGDKRSVNQVKLTLETVRRVYRWGVANGVIPPTQLTVYPITFGQDAKRQRPEMGEYTALQRKAILAQFDPRHVRRWRPYVLTALLATLGGRVTAARYVEWDDVTLTVAWTEAGPVFGGTLRWRPETAKTGTDRVQVLTQAAAEALWVAYGWALYDRYPGRYVLYGVARKTRGAALRRNSRDSKKKESLAGITVHERPWSYTAFLEAHHEAADRAGIPRRKWTGAHGHRRGLSGDVYDATGDEKAAADVIGDKSVKVVRGHYLLDRLERSKQLAETVDALMDAEQTLDRSETETTTKRYGPAGKARPKETNR